MCPLMLLCFSMLQVTWWAQSSATPSVTIWVSLQSAQPWNIPTALPSSPPTCWGSSSSSSFYFLSLIHTTTSFPHRFAPSPPPPAPSASLDPLANPPHTFLLLSSHLLLMKQSRLFFFAKLEFRSGPIWTDSAKSHVGCIAMER